MVWQLRIHRRGFYSGIGRRVQVLDEAQDLGTAQIPGHTAIGFSARLPGQR